MSKSDWTESPLINDFCYDDHSYHWLVIQGRNDRGYHLGINESCNQIESFATSKKQFFKNKNQIHHSLIKTLRNATKNEIINSLVDLDNFKKLRKHLQQQKQTQNDKTTTIANNSEEKYDTETTVASNTDVADTVDAANKDTERKESQVESDETQEEETLDMLDNILNYDWQSGTMCNNNGKNSKISKHGLVIAYTGHGDKNGNMWIGNTKSKPSLKQSKQMAKQQKKWQKKNLGSFDDSKENKKRRKQYNSQIASYSQSVTLDWIIANMFEIMKFANNYYNCYNNSNVIIDHLIILHDGCSSGNWVYKLAPIVTKYNNNNNNSINNSIEIKVSLVTGSNKNESSYEIQGNPNNGGRFYRLLLFNSTYVEKYGKINGNSNNGCHICQSIKNKKKTNYKNYHKNNAKCEHLNNETILANHNNMLLEWSNDSKDIIVVQSKFA